MCHIWFALNDMFQVNWIEITLLPKLENCSLRCSTGNSFSPYGDNDLICCRGPHTSYTLTSFCKYIKVPREQVTIIITAFPSAKHKQVCFCLIGSLQLKSPSFRHKGQKRTSRGVFSFIDLSNCMTACGVERMQSRDRVSHEQMGLGFLQVKRITWLNTLIIQHDLIDTHT